MVRLAPSFRRASRPTPGGGVCTVPEADSDQIEMRCSIVVAVLVFGITGVCQPEAGARRIPYETDNSTRRTRDDQGDEQRNLKPPRDYNTTSHHPAPTSPALCNNAAVEKRAPGVAIAVYPLSGGQYEPPGRRDNATRRHPTLTTPALCNNAAVEKRAPGVAIAVYPPSGGQYKPPGRRDNATRRHPALATPAQCNSAAVEKRASGTAVANTMSNEDDGNEQRDRPRGDDAHAEPKLTTPTHDAQGANRVDPHPRRCILHPDASYSAQSPEGNAESCGNTTANSHSDVQDGRKATTSRNA
ncbi:hypothetical protein DIPPA_19696 [Diplonema papillatum]|nr:hypothetical protein DIPPA_19696 [Diplonema papillatum]